MPGPCADPCDRDIVIPSSPATANLLDRTIDGSAGARTDPWVTGHIASSSRQTFTWTVPPGQDIASVYWIWEYTVVQGFPDGSLFAGTPGTYRGSAANVGATYDAVTRTYTLAVQTHAHTGPFGVSFGHEQDQYNHPDWVLAGHPEFGVNYPSQYDDSFFFEVDITCFKLVLHLKCPQSVTEIPSGTTQTICADVSEHIAGSFFLLPDWIKAGQGWVIDKIGLPGHWSHGPSTSPAPAVIGVDACNDLIVSMDCSPYPLTVAPLGSVLDGPLIAVRMLRVFNDPSSGWTYDIATSRPFNWTVQEVCDGVGPPPIPIPPPPPIGDVRGIDALYWKEGYHVAEIVADMKPDGKLEDGGKLQVVTRWREDGPFDDPIIVNENLDCTLPKLSHRADGPPLALVYMRPGGIFRHESYDYGATWLADPQEDMAFFDGSGDMATNEAWNDRTGERLLFFTAAGIKVVVYGPDLDPATGRLKQQSTYVVTDKSDNASFGVIYIRDSGALDCVVQVEGKRKVFRSHDDARTWQDVT